MKVLMLLESSFPPDPRVEKEILSLVDDGHYVYILCLTYINAPVFEKKDGWEIHRINVNRSIFDKFRVTFLAFPFYFMWWKKHVMHFLKKHTVDVIHVHDLPLSKIALDIKKKQGVKVVLDQHEFFSSWIVRTSYMNSFIGKIICFFSNFKEYERMSLERADIVITVAEPLRDLYLKEYDIQSGRLLMIPNTPTRRIFNRSNIETEIVEKYSDEFIIFYAGGIDSLRGIDTAIQGLSKIKEVIPNAKIVLGGKIAKDYDYTVAAKKFGVEEAVDFVGWIDEKLLPSYIVASKVCFHTPPSSEEVDNTIATKVYQYAIMQCPVIVSKARMMAEYVESGGFGVSVDSSDDFAAAVIKQDGENSLFNRKPDTTKLVVWEETVQPLISSYRQL